MIFDYKFEPAFQLIVSNRMTVDIFTSYSFLSIHVVLKMDLIQWSAFIMLTFIIEISLTVKCYSSNLN